MLVDRVVLATDYPDEPVLPGDASAPAILSVHTTDLTGVLQAAVDIDEAGAGTLFEAEESNNRIEVEVPEACSPTPP